MSDATKLLDEFRRYAGLIDSALAKPVPFRVVYRVAEVRDGNLHIFPDVYGKVGAELEREVIEVLREHGVDLDDVDRAKLDRLLEKGRTRKVSMSIDTLTSAAPRQIRGLP